MDQEENLAEPQNAPGKALSQNKPPKGSGRLFR